MDPSLVFPDFRTTKHVTPSTALQRLWRLSWQSFSSELGHQGWLFSDLRLQPLICKIRQFEVKQFGKTMENIQNSITIILQQNVYIFHPCSVQFIGTAIQHESIWDQRICSEKWTWMTCQCLWCTCPADEMTTWGSLVPHRASHSITSQRWSKPVAHRLKVPTSPSLALAVAMGTLSWFVRNVQQTTLPWLPFRYRNLASWIAEAEISILPILIKI